MVKFPSMSADRVRPLGVLETAGDFSSLEGANKTVAIAAFGVLHNIAVVAHADLQHSPMSTESAGVVSDLPTPAGEETKIDERVIEGFQTVGILLKLAATNPSLFTVEQVGVKFGRRQVAIGIKEGRLPNLRQFSLMVNWGIDESDPFLEDTSMRVSLRTQLSSGQYDLTHPASQIKIKFQTKRDGTEHIQVAVGERNLTKSSHNVRDTYHASYVLDYDDPSVRSDAMLSQLAQVYNALTGRGVGRMDLDTALQVVIDDKIVQAADTAVYRKELGIEEYSPIEQGEVAQEVPDIEPTGLTSNGLYEGEYTAEEWVVIKQFRGLGAVDVSGVKGRSKGRGSGRRNSWSN